MITARTALSAAALPTAASRASFISAVSALRACGRLSVVVATVSSRLQHTLSVTVRSLSTSRRAKRIALKATVYEPGRARQEPGRFGLDSLGRLVPGPVRGEQLRWQAGVGEEELAPFVHQPAAQGEDGLVGRAGPGRRDEIAGQAQPALVGAGEPVQVP